MHNSFEQHKVMIIGEGYTESVTFEGLPDDLEDELRFGDCHVNKSKSVVFSLVNNGEKAVKFRWNQGDKEEFRFQPSYGHLKPGSSKDIRVVFKSAKSVNYDKITLNCETFLIDQKGEKFVDWDDTMKTMRMVRPSEYKKIMRERELEEIKRKKEAEIAAAEAAKAAKGGKAPAKAPAKKEEPQPEEEIQIDMSEDPNVELIEVIQEPEFEKVEGSERSVALKTTLVCDYAQYQCSVPQIDFKPTLMYAQRVYKFSIKNTSLINLDYNFNIANAETGILDAGPYSIIPKKGTISPTCDENFIVKFSPMEVEPNFCRILSANIKYLSPE